MLCVDLVGHLDCEEPIVVVLIALRAIGLLAHRHDLVDLSALTERAEEPQLVRENASTQLDVRIVAIGETLRRNDVRVAADVVRLQVFTRVRVVSGPGEVIAAGLDDGIQLQPMFGVSAEWPPMLTTVSSIAE
jgi:hypothetical protein